MIRQPNQLSCCTAARLGGVPCGMLRQGSRLQTGIWYTDARLGVRGKRPSGDTLFMQSTLSGRVPGI